MDTNMTKRDLEQAVEEVVYHEQAVINHDKRVLRQQKKKTRRWRTSTIILAIFLGFAAASAATLGSLFAIAKNTPEYCKITFDPNGGTISGGSEIYSKRGIQLGTLALPNATKSEMIFGGWSAIEGGKKPVDPSTVISQNVTYYAIWNPVSESDDQNATTIIDNQKWDCVPETLCGDPSKDIELHQPGSSLVKKIKKSEFNSPVTIGKDILYIGNDFMNGCTSFNSNIVFPEDSSLVYIGQGFLENCNSFNKIINLPSTVKCIASSFMYGCTTYNEALSVGSEVSIIGDNFLSECASFNHDLIIPETVTNVGSCFMFNCQAMCSTIEINAGPENFVANDEATLSSPNKTCPMVATGVKISGKKKHEFVTAFPTLPESSFFKRNLHEAD